MTLNLKAKSVAGAVALSFVAAGVSATPIDLTYDGPSANPNTNVNITDVPLLSPALSAGSVPAYGFKMSSSTLDDFLAWCLDLQHNLGAIGTAHKYEITSAPFSNTFDFTASGALARVQNVFDANFNSVDATDGDEAAGFQLALWEAVYDEGYSLTDGNFKATADAGALNAANDYLSAASSYTDPKVFNLTFYESTGSVQKQNLVSAAPVPLPAAGFLLLAGLGGLVAMRRKRKDA